MRDYERFQPFTSVDLNILYEYAHFVYDEYGFMGEFSVYDKIEFAHESNYEKTIIGFDFKVLYSAKKCVVLPRMIIHQNTLGRAHDEHSIYLKSGENRWEILAEKISEEDGQYKCLVLLSLNDVISLGFISKNIKFKWFAETETDEITFTECFRNFYELCKKSGVLSQEFLTKRKDSLIQITDFD